jgi:hypothetical protein
MKSHEMLGKSWENASVVKIGQRFSFISSFEGNARKSVKNSKLRIFGQSKNRMLLASVSQTLSDRFQ